VIRPRPARVVIPGGLQRVQDVVGVGGADVVVHVLGEPPIGIRERRRLALAEHRLLATSASMPAATRRPQAARCSGRPAMPDRFESRRSQCAATCGCGRDLAGQARKRHEGVGEVRIHLAHSRRACRPSTCRSRAAGGSRQPFRQQPVLRRHHVAIAVLRERRPQSVARLARLAVADVVHDHDVVRRGVQQLARAEQLAGELGLRNCAPEPVVPCSTRTAFTTRPAASLRAGPVSGSAAQLGEEPPAANEKLRMT